MPLPRLAILLHDIRSAHNVGVILRTADAVGAVVYTSGLTPHPPVPQDSRPPHVADRALKLIAKTALGAETSVFAGHFEHPEALIEQSKQQGRSIIGLERLDAATSIFEFTSPAPVLLIAGHEVLGVPQAVQQLCDHVLVIPMRGLKESLNVAVAVSIAAYQLTQPPR